MADQALIDALPREMDVAGYRWTVEPTTAAVERICSYHAEGMDPDRVYGVSSERTQEIGIHPDAADDKFVETAVHEAFHAVYARQRPGDRHSEAMIGPLAAGVVDLIRANPEFALFVLNSGRRKYALVPIPPGEAP